MLVLHHPAVRTIVGGDPHRGWLPSGARPPLVTSPQPALVELRILKVKEGYEVRWAPHQPEHMPLPSAKDVRKCDSLESAIVEAHRLFGIAESDWPIDTRRADVGPEAVQELVDIVFTAWGISTADGVDAFRRVTEPQATQIAVPDGESLHGWTVLRHEDGRHAIYYDPNQGAWGWAAPRADDSGFVDIGLHDSLWVAMAWW